MQFQRCRMRDMPTRSSELCAAEILSHLVVPGCIPCGSTRDEKLRSFLTCTPVQSHAQIRASFVGLFMNIVLICCTKSTTSCTRIKVWARLLQIAMTSLLRPPQIASVALCHTLCSSMSVTVQRFIVSWTRTITRLAFS